MNRDRPSLRESMKDYYKFLGEMVTDIVPPVIFTILTAIILSVFGWGIYQLIIATGYPVIASIISILLLIFVIGPVAYYYVAKFLQM